MRGEGAVVAAIGGLLSGGLWMSDQFFVEGIYMSMFIIYISCLLQSRWITYNTFEFFYDNALY